MNNPTLVIRPFDAAADTEALATLWLEASRIAHPFIGEQRLVEHQQLVREKYLPVAETWVASFGYDPVGFISLLDTYIGALFVTPKRQGLGIGRKLIAHALARKGELSLEVYSRNKQAVRFYNALGFKEVSRRAEDDEGLPFENAFLRLTP